MSFNLQGDLSFGTRLPTTQGKRRRLKKFVKRVREMEKALCALAHGEFPSWWSVWHIDRNLMNMATENLIALPPNIMAELRIAGEKPSRAEIYERYSIQLAWRELQKAEKKRKKAEKKERKKRAIERVEARRANIASQRARGINQPHFPYIKSANLQPKPFAPKIIVRKRVTSA